ncbi:Hypothetical predicted protein [Octopus vulgaris]|uniref:Uncharacterized protein n=1 Tax=Octopus vulgaris TaxID=6645 RepID=A0AA36BIV5_OCTVU|nr:Hypothetical predicted protein [Octopus vulgaris]
MVTIPRQRRCHGDARSHGNDESTASTNSPSRRCHDVTATTTPWQRRRHGGEDIICYNDDDNVNENMDRA